MPSLAGAVPNWSQEQPPALPRWMAETQLLEPSLWPVRVQLARSWDGGEGPGTGTRHSDNGTQASQEHSGRAGLKAGAGVGSRCCPAVPASGHLAQSLLLPIPDFAWSPKTQGGLQFRCSFCHLLLIIAVSASAHSGVCLCPVSGADGHGWWDSLGG